MVDIILLRSNSLVSFCTDTRNPKLYQMMKALLVIFISTRQEFCYLVGKNVVSVTDWYFVKQILLEDLRISMHDILPKCQETLKSFCKKKKMKKVVQFFKNTSLSVRLVLSVCDSLVLSTISPFYIHMYQYKVYILEQSAFSSATWGLLLKFIGWTNL